MGKKKSGVSLLQSEAVCNRKQPGGAVNPEINLDCHEDRQYEQLLYIELFKLKKMVWWPQLLLVNERNRE